MKAAFAVAFVALLVTGVRSFAQHETGDTSKLEFKQFGQLAIQDGGRRKPIDTFARETLTQVTGRSSYTDKNGRY